MKHILDAISKCSSLVQLHLIVPSYNDLFGSGLTAQLFNYRILNLVDSLTKLVCLYCFLDVPQSHCATATKLLVETVTPKRPSFCAELLSQQVRPKYSSSLPFVHSRPLLDFKEDYSSLPYGDWLDCVAVRHARSSAGYSRINRRSKQPMYFICALQWNGDNFVQQAFKVNNKFSSRSSPMSLLVLVQDVITLVCTGYFSFVSITWALTDSVMVFNGRVSHNSLLNPWKNILNM